MEAYVLDKVVSAVKGGPKTPSQFASMTCWLFCMTFFTYAYSSLLRSFLIVPLRERTVDTLQKLVQKHANVLHYVPLTLDFTQAESDFEITFGNPSALKDFLEVSLSRCKE